MSPSVRFERSHEIVIDAPAGDILDYVSNPNIWPEWIAASHHIDSPPRPLATRSCPDRASGPRLGTP